MSISGGRTSLFSWFSTKRKGKVNFESTDFNALMRFTYAELAEATNGFSNEMLIRHDRFGDFYKGILQDHKEITIKQYRETAFDSDCGFHSEVNMERCMIHKNIVSIVGYCSQGEHKFLVYESVPNDCLRKHLFGDHVGNTPLLWEYRMKIAVGTAKALRYLHEECLTKIIHRDIKSSNILLDYDYEPKVTGFAVAKIFQDNESDILDRVIGTMGYLDPEYCMTGRLTENADTYSFGIVLLELVTGKNPSELNEPRSVLLLLLHGLENNGISSLVDRNLNDVYDFDEMSRMIICAAMCLHPSSEWRLRISQIIKVLEDRGLLAKDVAHITAYTGSDPQDPNKRFELDDLKMLAIQLLDLALEGEGNYAGSATVSRTSSPDNLSDSEL